MTLDPPSIRFIGGPFDSHRIELPDGIRVPWTLTLGYWYTAPLGEIVYQNHVPALLDADYLMGNEWTFRLSTPAHREYVIGGLQRIIDRLRAENQRLRQRLQTRKRH